MIMESKELIALLQNIQKQQEILIARMPNPRLGFRTRGIPLEAVFCNSSNASTWYWLDRSTDENGIATPLKTELCARPEILAFKKQQTRKGEKTVIKLYMSAVPDWRPGAEPNSLVRPMLVAGYQTWVANAICKALANTDPNILKAEIVISVYEADIQEGSEAGSTTLACALYDAQGNKLDSRWKRSDPWPQVWETAIGNVNLANGREWEHRYYTQKELEAMEAGSASQGHQVNSQPQRSGQPAPPSRPTPPRPSTPPPSQPPPQPSGSMFSSKPSPRPNYGQNDLF
jgi:hypothetical protein